MCQPEKLKARRKELKMTQKDIADQLGITYQAYSAWERGIKQPSREKIKLLEQILMFQKVILQRSKSSDYIILYRMKVRIMHLVMSEA